MFYIKLDISTNDERKDVRNTLDDFYRYFPQNDIYEEKKKDFVRFFKHYKDYKDIEKEESKFVAQKNVNNYYNN
jgi:hypothetical protein